MCLSAPRMAFFPPSGSMLPGAPQPSFLSSTGPVARNGLSLACNGFRLRGLHSRVNVPGLLLRFLHGCSHARSAYRSTAGSGSPRSRPLPCLSPLPVRFRARSTLAKPPLPFGSVTSLWIKAFCLVAADQSAFRLRPISSRSPLPFLLLGKEADHRSRPATFSEACCSSNLLEP